ncbi:hypothetical protein K439DRAFT_324748 [Ramaria rubella]|nr:hypothetical protein K439DRAFT_324748 [Ramaria rubella]
MRIEEGIDLWLRDANQGLPAKKSSEWEFMPMRNWVLHATRAVTFDPPSEYHATEDLSDEDRLDLENRYWQYMSTHPAHASLPQTAYDEAVEILTWCYAGTYLTSDSSAMKILRHIDRVLRTPQPLPVPLPFTQKECIDLLELLRNVTASSTSTSTHVVRTRLISQILLRYTEWRQKYVTKSAPDKRGNTLSGRPMEVEHAVPFRQTFHRFIKAVLCLGIPYLFEAQDSDRGGWISDRPTDEEEQGPPNSPRPGDALLGNGQPLVAALLLSASVTMLALPDLDKTSRVAALISALCSASSMVSFVITLHERQNRRTLTTSARQTSAILASLPLVMLAYSLCAFVVGVIAYAISGGITSNRAGGFGKFTGWIVIAVWIALVAVLASSSALTKRGQ